MNGSITKTRPRTRAALIIGALLLLFAVGASGARADVRIRTSRRVAAATRDHLKSVTEKHLLELSEIYEYPFRGNVVVFITATDEEYRETAGDGVPHWSVAVARRGLVVVSPRANVTGAQFDATLRHELSHVALAEMFAHRPQALPRWLNEGLAMRVSGEWDMPENWLDGKAELYNALRGGSLMDLDEISDGFPASGWRARLAYAQSFYFTDYIIGRIGQKKMNIFIMKLSRGEEFNKSFKKATGRNFDNLQETWRARVRGAGGMTLLFLALAGVDSLVWVAMAVLVIIAFARWLWLRYRDKSEEDEFDGDDDDDELWEEWDEETMGHRPWRPSRRKKGSD